MTRTRYRASRRSESTILSPLSARVISRPRDGLDVFQLRSPQGPTEPDEL